MNEILITLQEHTTHQEREITRLSEELYTQQQEILGLRKQLERLESILEKAVQGGTIYDNTADVPPPHY